MVLITLTNNDTVGVVFTMATSYSDVVKVQCTYHVGHY